MLFISASRALELGESLIDAYEKVHEEGAHIGLIAVGDRFISTSNFDDGEAIFIVSPE